MPYCLYFNTRKFFHLLISYSDIATQVQVRVRVNCACVHGVEAQEWIIRTHVYTFEGNCVKDSMMEFEQTVERIKDIWTVKFSRAL